MGNKIITISREFGSGGRTIGKLVAEKLGIPCYDKEIIEKVAESSGFTSEYIKQQGEYAAHRTRLGMALEAQGLSGYLSNQDSIWIEQRKIILDLAEKGPCVIVGRCADSILKDRDDVLTVFIHASMAYRAERIVKVYGETEEAPEKRLKDKDKRRIAYYRYYTDTKWGVAQNYDVSLDSGRLGIDKCVEIITSLY
jgi:cytidylate kinase